MTRWLVVPMRESHHGVKTTAHKHSTTINAADYPAIVRVGAKTASHDIMRGQDPRKGGNRLKKYNLCGIITTDIVN